jgi:PPE-repeat protein
MKDLFFHFDPGTTTSRAPMPTDFRHLLGWAPKDERYIVIHNQEQLIDIDAQLDQTLNLQVSNIIQRVIAQIIGLTAQGWKTIKATEAGALMVALDGIISDTKTLVTAKIDIVPAATTFTITATSGQKIHVVHIFFTVGAETNIVFKDGSTALTGAMDFGASGEPRGVVMPLGLAPLICSSGEDFVIDLSTAVQVSGYCIYYKQLA